MKRAAAQVGRLGFGPVCARRLGLLAPPSVRYALFDVRRRQERDELTLDLFEQEAA